MNCYLMGLDVLIFTFRSIYLHPFYVCESSEGSRDIAPKHIQ